MPALNSSPPPDLVSMATDFSTVTELEGLGVGFIVLSALGEVAAVTEQDSFDSVSIAAAIDFPCCDLVSMGTVCRGFTPWLTFSDCWLT